MQIAISQTIKNECKDYFYITLGLLLYTFGWTSFPASIPDSNGWRNGYRSRDLLRHGDTYLFVLFSHQCSLAACRAEDTGIQVHGEDHRLFNFFAAVIRRFIEIIKFSSNSICPRSIK